MKELKPPDPGQVVKLFCLAQESDPDLATFIMLAASSGARRGELLALRWSDIDLERRTLSIERGIVRVGDNLVEQGTKTHQIDASHLIPVRSLHRASIISRRWSEPDRPSPRSHRRASYSATPSTAQHLGIRTRRPEPSGGFVSRLG